MQELRIYDKVNSENFIISLGELIKSIEKIEPNILEGKWEIAKGAYGYGELICSIEDELSSGKQYQTDGSYIFPIIKSKEQYFYHVSMKKIDSDIELGVFDSTYLFFRSNNEELLKEIQAFFNDGMTNKELRKMLPDLKPSVISRILKRLRLHGIIKKVGKSCKYYLSTLGKQIIIAGLAFKNMTLIHELARA